MLKAWRAHKSSEGIATRAAIAYEQAVRGLDSQALVLVEARARANYLIVATVGVATLFAGFLLKGPSPGRALDIAAAVPLVLLLIGVSCAAAVLRPTGKQGATGKLELVASARMLLAADATSAAVARVAAAEGLEAMWDRNQPLIEAFMRKLRISARCLEVQVASWTLLLIFKQVF
jgi:hypothetical protein